MPPPKFPANLLFHITPAFIKTLTYKGNISYITSELYLILISELIPYGHGRPRSGPVSTVYAEPDRNLTQFLRRPMVGTKLCSTSAETQSKYLDKVMLCRSIVTIYFEC